MMVSDEIKAKLNKLYLYKNILTCYCRYGLFCFAILALRSVGSCSEICWKILYYMIR